MKRRLNHEQYKELPVEERQKFKQMGLDEDFTPGCFEDNLFCDLILRKGYKLKIASCFIQHFSGVTFNQKNDSKKAQEYLDLLARNQRIWLKKLDIDIRVSLCMIVSDREKPETLKRCLDSVVDWIDEIVIVFNYKRFKNNRKVNRLIDVIPRGRLLEIEYTKFTNFADMRNISLDMATGNYILWMDTDDIMITPQAIKELPKRFPDADVFRCKINSFTEKGSTEIITHNRIFKNKKEYRFRGSVHEDISLSQIANKAEMILTGITINHLGYMDKKSWARKNKRNYAFLLKDIESPDAHSLTYYHMVNSLMLLGGRDNFIKAIGYIDKAFEKFKFRDKDPLLPKLWMVRGMCCEKCGQIDAAKQSYHKAFDDYKSQEAAINLGEFYSREGKWDRAIEILMTIHDKQYIEMTNIPVDAVEIEYLMWFKLAECWAHKANDKKNKDPRGVCLENAEKFYRNALGLRFNIVVVDRLCQILRNRGNFGEANLFAITAVNKAPRYYEGWNNLASFEIQANRLVTARVFLKEALRWNPRHKEARLNLTMIENIRKGKNG